MLPEITPEQNNQLQAWAVQRDKILQEISSLQNEKYNLSKENSQLADSNTDIQNRMIMVSGRIEELNKKEEELPQLLRKDIASLNVTKSTLQTEVESLSKIIDTLTLQKESLKNDISFLMATFDLAHERVGLLDKVIGHVTTVSSENKKNITDLVKSVMESMQVLVEKNNEAITKTNDTINEIPKVFLEVRKKSLVKPVIDNKK